MTAPAGPLRILFVCGADFDAPSEKQALWLARELRRLGHAVTISLRGNPASAASEGAGEIAGLGLIWHSFPGPRPSRSAVGAAAAFRPQLIHAWSSRHPTIKVAEAYREASAAPVFVHWEDHEWSLMEGLPGRSAPRRAAHALRKVGSRLHPPFWHFSTPWSLAWVESNATAFDALTPALAEEVKARTGRDCEVILPASAPEAWEGGAGSAPPLPSRFEASEILLYTGDINFGREPDIKLGLMAAAEAQRRGFDVTFIHAGRNSAGSDVVELAREAGMSPGSALVLGVLPFDQIPPLLRRASILVQPGHPTDFNRFGLPSKLQAYLASGTPVITFAAGSGELLADREEVLKTYGAEPAELADRIAELLSDAELRRTLSENGPKAARRLFDPASNAEKLLAHYRRWLGVSEPGPGSAWS